LEDFKLSVAAGEASATTFAAIIATVTKIPDLRLIYIFGQR
jgi:hypothetical protein